MMSGTIYLFPGQGSQFPGMARELSRYPSGAELLALAESRTELPLGELLSTGDVDAVAHPQVAQLGVLVHSLAMLDVQRTTDPVPPVAVAGHSLGDYTALVAAGVIDVEEAIGLVAQRGALMAEAATRSQGAMLAVVGLEEAELSQMCQDAAHPVVIANDNGRRQLVVSGHRHGVEAVEQRARAAGALRVRRLPVGGAYHSPLMLPAVDGMRRALAEVSPRTPAIPVVASSSGRLVSDAHELWRLLEEQITAPVRWAGSMAALRSLEPDGLVEVGPGRVLTGLVRGDLRGVPVRRVGAPSRMRPAVTGVSGR